MTKQTISQVLKKNNWALVEGENEAGLFLIRYRTAITEPLDTRGCEQLLTVVWPYAEEGSGELPGEEPYPIELTTEYDPEWTYAREEILGGVDS